MTNSQLATKMKEQTVRDHLKNFYGNNPEFGEEGGINEKWAWLDFGLIKIPFPNFTSRSEIIYLHDLNHVINNYDTSWKGEVSVSAWEVSTGLGRFLTGWLFASFAFGFGVLTYPRATYKAFMRGRVTKSLFQMDLPKEQLLQMPLVELKRLTRHEELNEEFRPGLVDNLKYLMSAGLSLSFFLTPFLALVLFTFWILS